ncbi:MAG: hypothetical protein FWB74_05375 [Defluviitaleaceae bacterium]|nr:hypothetical protein [Defluviitaleaceae bacterium]
MSSNNTSSSSLRILLVIIGIVFTAVVSVVLFLGFRTSWEPAFSSVDAASLSAIESALRDEGISTRLDAENGVIYVPEQYVDRAWVIVQTSIPLNEAAFSFERAIESSGLGVNRAEDVTDMILYMREREIEDTLMAIDEIVEARVHVQSGVSAHVSLFGSDLTAQMGETAAMIAARSIAGLDVENVEVFDEDGVRLFPEYSLSPEVDWGYIFEEMWEFVNPAADALGIGLGAMMPHDFPGGPLFSEEFSEQILEMFDDSAVRRFLYETVHNIESFEMLETWTHVMPMMPSYFPGGPLFGEEFSEQILEMFDNSAIRQFIYDVIVNIELP